MAITEDFVAPVAGDTVLFSGHAIGDVLIVGAANPNSSTIATPSGFFSCGLIVGTSRRLQIFAKIPDSTDALSAVCTGAEIIGGVVMSSENVLLANISSTGANSLSSLSFSLPSVSAISIVSASLNAASGVAVAFGYYGNETTNIATTIGAYLIRESAKAAGQELAIFSTDTAFTNIAGPSTTLTGTTGPVASQSLLVLDSGIPRSLYGSGGVAGFTGIRGTHRTLGT